jgi:hypothetical protein
VLCQRLSICELVKAGVFQGDFSGSWFAKLLGPETDGYSVFGEFSEETIEIEARISWNMTGKRIGTLIIGGKFPGHAWVNEVDVKIHPFKHWMFQCQSCGRLVRSLFWPPQGKRWACSKCHALQYPDKRRPHTSPPAHPDLNRDRLDKLESDLRKLREIDNRLRKEWYAGLTRCAGRLRRTSR